MHPMSHEIATVRIIKTTKDLNWYLTVDNFKRFAFYNVRFWGKYYLGLAFTLLLTSFSIKIYFVGYKILKRLQTNGVSC